ncbi:response regulator, partial [Vibrio parahaemolyticus]|nr:response regulator [Vibrio parahaemolyticus]
MIKILERIMEDKDLGDVVGYTTDGIDAVNKITANQPDIVLIDLLLPNKDGINIVKEFQKEVFKPIFVMISQVSSKDMIAKAYEA